MTKSRMDSHQWDSALDPEVVTLFLHLHWAKVRSVDSMRPVLVKFHLSVAEFDVLATLRNAPAPHEMTPTQIQDEVVITSGGLTKVMLQLKARGLVARFRSESDLRVKPVRLTTSGKKLIEIAMKEIVSETGAWFRRALSKKELGQLTAMLKRLVETPQT